VGTRPLTPPRAPRDEVRQARLVSRRRRPAPARTLASPGPCDRQRRRGRRCCSQARASSGQFEPDDCNGLLAAASFPRSAQDGTAGLRHGSTPRLHQWSSRSARGCSTDRTATSLAISAPDAGTVNEPCSHSATSMSPQPTSVPLSADTGALVMRGAGLVVVRRRLRRVAGGARRDWGVLLLC
jgi:hypothetical protein